MTKEEKLIAKKLDSERRKLAWKQKLKDEEKEFYMQNFMDSIKKISSEIDAIFYGYKKIDSSIFR